MKSVNAVVKLKMSLYHSKIIEIINEGLFILFISTILFGAAGTVEIDNSHL